MPKSNPIMGGKRRRGAEDEVYFDNYHNHKRFLTEVMASSMNGLSVSDAVNASSSRRPSSPLVDPMLSPAETMCTISRSASSFPSQGDETSTLDSLMSEDSDESVGYRFSRGSEALAAPPPQCPSSFTSELASRDGHLVLPPHGPGSPCSQSPRRFQRHPCHSSGQALPSGGTQALTWVSGSRIPATPSWPRFPETEGRLPPSPNDPCQAPDLRRATLLRNLSLRTQLPSQPTSFSSTTTAPDKKKAATAAAEESLQEEQDDACEVLEEEDEEEEEEIEVEDGEDQQSSLNPMSCHFYEYPPEQVECSSNTNSNSTSIMGSPMHGMFPGHVTRGSSRVRSLVLGETPIIRPRPKALLTTTAAEIGNSSSNSKEDIGGLVVTTFDKPSSSSSRFEEEASYNNRSPRSPRSPNAAASSSGYEVSSSASPKDGNVSDTESSFSRRSARTSLYAR